MAILVNTIMNEPAAFLVQSYFELVNTAFIPSDGDNWQFLVHGLFIADDRDIMRPDQVSK